VANAIHKLVTFLQTQSADAINREAQHQQASSEATSEISRAIKGLASQLKEGGELARAVKGLTSHLKQAGELARAINNLTSHLEQATQRGLLENAVQPPTSSIQQAVELYEEVHAREATAWDVRAAFTVLRNNLDALIFTSIKDKALRSLWLKFQIDELVGSASE
jgi:hypothetical protein